MTRYRYRKIALLLVLLTGIMIYLIRFSREDVDDSIEPELQQRLQQYSYAIVEAIEVIGGTNIQFAHDPKTGRVVVIEINPRTSRSSALASKATGFPIARVSSLLAGGLTLDEIPYWRDGTLEKYTPSGDYVVVKFARWAFEKFEGVEDKLGTQMRAVGEVMSIGKTYKEAFQKSIRSLEIGRYGLGFARDFHDRSLDELMRMLAEPSSVTVVGVVPSTTSLIELGLSATLPVLLTVIV